MTHCKSAIWLALMGELLLASVAFAAGYALALLRKGGCGRDPILPLRRRPKHAVIDCEIILVANHGSDLTMGDTKEGTFGIRLAQELNSLSGHTVNSVGAEGEKAIWGKRTDWVDYDGTVVGDDLGVAVFDNPRSFRHPTYWHARGYGLLAANPFG
jgi:hypothetical protein